MHPKLLKDINKIISCILGLAHIVRTETRMIPVKES